ncbi:MAG: hypothetical protein HZA10_08985 [Nitrospirae bacterium]|nr:hypothetical protein [Nitrospirota bacterium]
MKLSIPPLEISETEGFANGKDIFKRKPFGEALYKLISNIEDELIIALDAKWGEGKTTFIKMWRGYLTENNIKSIYFDAFSNDYMDDPFTALSGEIYDLAKALKVPEEKIKKYKDKAVQASKVLLKSGMKIGIKALTIGVLDGTELENLGADKDIADEAAKTTEQYLSHVFDNYKEDKACLNNFRLTLQELAGAVSSDGKPVVFIIDELDRCKPTFALELLEKIKHVFSVQKIVFVLVMNREQIEESVRCQYGSGIKANQYLQKFVNIWCSLPKNASKYGSDLWTYYHHLMKLHNYQITSQHDENLNDFMKDYIGHCSLSLRELEQIVVNIILVKTTMYSLNNYHEILIPFLAIVKVANPGIYQKLRESKCTYEELYDSFDLQYLVTDWFEGKNEKHPLTWLLRYCLMSDEDLKKIEPKDYFAKTGMYDSQRQSVIPFIFNSMSTFTFTQ